MSLRSRSYWDLADLAGENIFDSRDVESRISDLESERDAVDDVETWQAENEDDAALLAALTELRDSVGGEWEDGIGFIADSHFVDYAREEANSSGYCDSDNPLFRHVDWQQWADDLQTDYSSVEVDGATFWYRS